MQNTKPVTEDRGHIEYDTLVKLAASSPSLDGNGHRIDDTHISTATPSNPLAEDGHVYDDIQSAGAVSPLPSICEEVHSYVDTQLPDDPLALEIRETHRMRQDLHRAEKSLTLQIKAIERRLSGAIERLSPTIEPPRTLNGDVDQHSNDTPIAVVDVAFFATLPLQEARETIRKGRLKIERRLTKLAKQLPVWPWVEDINGFGPLGLAQIIGEAGNLGNYANPAKLWKRMGLAVINGKSQRRVTGDAAIEQGYSPIRRSIMFCIGDSMIKKQNLYREVYLARLALEHQKALNEGLIPTTTMAATIESWAKRGLPPLKKITEKTFKATEHRSAGHMNKRAQRYMEKRLLRDLWRAWRKVQMVAA